VDASITKLRTRPDRLRADQAEHLRQLVLSFPGGLPDRAAGELVAAIDRHTASTNGWTFIMLSPVQNAAVVGWIKANSRRPIQAMLVWAECFTALRHDTAEIVLTREELAERTQTTPREISRIMSELEACGAISRRVVRVPGMRGRGVTRYYMNPNVATRLAGAARDAAQARAPRQPGLSLVYSGEGAGTVAGGM